MKRLSLALISVLVVGVGLAQDLSLITPINNPFKPFVRLVPVLGESGKAFLELRNDFHSVVKIEGLYLTHRKRASKIAVGKEVAPAETFVVDITAELGALFALASNGEQLKKLDISLNLQPEPPGQKPFQLEAKFRNGRLTFFSEATVTIKK